jgi:para-nitrobenzyl esterase
MSARVTVREGTLEGYEEGRVKIFLGIPFAAPPTGALRWRAPQPAPSWKGVREAKRFGPQAVQTVGGGERRSSQMSEDCLTLNVWTASLDADSRQPVMVWIHGGGNIGGSGSEQTYDGASLAGKGITAVTFNYRLGALGFLARPEVGTNFAVLDQVAVLEWVRDNICQFGGDPGCVTIYGESAGAVNVRTLLCAPRARGLFHRAIIQSAGFERFAFAPGWSLARAQQAGEKLFDRLGSRDPERLRSVQTEELRVASHDLSGIFPPPGQVHTPANLVWMPVPDGEIVTEEFCNWHRDLPVMFGCLENEARYFIRPEREYDWGLVRKMAHALCGPRADDVMRMLESKGITAYEALDKLFSTVIWFEPALAMVRRLISEGNKRFYYYHFARVSPGARRSNELVMHSAEMRYHFNTLTDGGYYDGHDRVIANGLQDAWIAFARNGVPQSPDGTEWPAFVEPLPRMAWIGDEFQVRPYGPDELVRAVNSLR